MPPSRAWFAAQCVVAWLCVAASDAAAQPIPADALRDLPASGNLFAVLETTQAEVVSDRFSSAGLNVSEPARIGGFLASWSQTRYRVGEIDLASPSDGTPLLFPELAWWDGVDIDSAMIGAGLNASGLAVSLQPVRPARTWSGRFEGFASGDGPGDFTDGHALVSGAVNPALAIAAGVNGSQNRSASRRSAFAHLVHAPSRQREARVLLWIQTTPVDRAVHVQGTWQHRPPNATAWSIFGGATQRARTNPSRPDRFIAERLNDGPIALLATSAEQRDRRFTMGIDLSPPPLTRHTINVGARVEHTAARASGLFAGTIGERIDGRDARVWVYANSGADSHRHATTIAGHLSDRITLSSRMTLDAGLRVEAVSARADGAATGVSWRSVLPDVHFRWDLGTRYDLQFFTAAHRAAHHLLLDLLAVGDPAAPAARVFRWDDAAAMTGPLVARAGPGTGGDPDFSRIDPALRRPRTDQFAIGLRSHPRAALRLSLIGVARRQSQIVQVVNTGVPATSYTTFTSPDANADLVRAADDQQLIVYDRPPASFGADRYLLTNPPVDAATMGAFVIKAEVNTPRVFLLIGATASAAVGSGGNRVFRSTENDPDVLGELFTNPNAATHARGRLFSDRAYTIKWTTVYRFPKDVRLGAIARYQDGQPFSRMVIVPGLNQGVEAIQAFPNGRSRFAFTGTLDVRLQKGFTIGRGRVDAILDAYNLLDMRKEVEEYVVTGVRFRETTLRQPARVFHLGVRVTFR